MSDLVGEEQLTSNLLTSVQQANNSHGSVQLAPKRQADQEQLHSRHLINAQRPAGQQHVAAGEQPPAGSWLASMSARLVTRVADLIYLAPQEPMIDLVSQNRGGLDQLTDALERVLAADDDDANDSGGLLMKSNNYYNARQANSSDQLVWHFLAQNQLVVYICGASNVHGLADKFDRQEMDQESRDKLGRAKPAFRALLVNANGK